MRLPPGIPGRSFRTTIVSAPVLLILAGLLSGEVPLRAAEGESGAKTVSPPAEPQEEKTDISKKRLEVMKEHALSLRVSSTADGWPAQLEPAPIFRYDDQTRGYVDGTVWRLGALGRPLAIITTELHPNYLGGGPRVVYDFLSLSAQPFEAVGGGTRWNSGASAVAMQRLPNAPAPADMPAARLSQMKKLSLRFSATQDLEETERVLVHLRRLPREIDRYVPVTAGKMAAGRNDAGQASETESRSSERADGSIFLFANGRNPAIVLLIETDGTTWSYGAGRLSAPSTLTLLLDDEKVWTVPPASMARSEGYSATNVSARFP